MFPVIQYTAQLEVYTFYSFGYQTKFNTKERNNLEIFLQSIRWYPYNEPRTGK